MSRLKTLVIFVVLFQKLSVAQPPAPPETDIVDTPFLIAMSIMAGFTVMIITYGVYTHYLRVQKANKKKRAEAAAQLLEPVDSNEPPPEVIVKSI